VSAKSRQRSVTARILYLEENAVKIDGIIATDDARK
jgi:hypothetical protein